MEEWGWWSSATTGLLRSFEKRTFLNVLLRLSETEKSGDSLLRRCNEIARINVKVSHAWFVKRSQEWLWSCEHGFVERTYQRNDWIWSCEHGFLARYRSRTAKELELPAKRIMLVPAKMLLLCFQTNFNIKNIIWGSTNNDYQKILKSF